jgi:predicted nucleic acid-binding protein
VPADPKDDPIVAGALESGASYIVSDDKHLLDLKQFDRITIMNRDEFERELDRLGVAR